MGPTVNPEKRSMLQTLLQAPGTSLRLQRTTGQASPSVFILISPMSCVTSRFVLEQRGCTCFQSQLIDDKAKKKQLQYQKSKIESVLQKPRRPSYLRNLAHNMRAITALSKSHKHLNLLCWVSHLTSSGLFCSHQWSPSESMSLSWFV